MLTLAFSIISMPSYAGKIYRFLDKEGVSTLSKVLPPYAAQQGYDILDDQSYRLIERVLAFEEALKINAEQRRLLAIQKKEQQQKLERIVHDRSLLNRYPNARVLIHAGNADLAFLKKQLSEAVNHKANNKQRLRDLQQQAAAMELNGDVVSPVLEEYLLTVKQDIISGQLKITRLQEKHALREALYKKDLIRLRELLGIKVAEPEEATVAAEE